MTVTVRAFADVSVHPERRGRGAGSALLAAAEQRLTGAGRRHGVRQGGRRTSGAATDAAGWPGCSAWTWPRRTCRTWRRRSGCGSPRRPTCPTRGPSTRLTWTSPGTSRARWRWTTLRRARDAGYRQTTTTNDAGNAAVLAVNRRLGYRAVAGEWRYRREFRP